MKRQLFNHKKRQLRALSLKLRQLLKSEESTELRERIILKIQKLLSELRFAISRSEVKRVLGAAAIIFGLTFSQNLQAQSFGPKQNNLFNLSGLSPYLNAPAFADMDNDGDIDLLVGQDYGTFAYFENTGSASMAQFANPVINPFGLDSTYYYAFPAFADLDGDGDMDLLAGEYYGALQYFENTGTATSPQFAAPVQNPFGLTSLYEQAFPNFTDLDGDGDLDLLVGEYYGDLQYFENTGSATNPQFAAPVANPFGLSRVSVIAFPSFGDLDEDGDMDLLVGQFDSVAPYSNTLLYFENTGTTNVPAFSTPVANPFGISGSYFFALPALADLDGDADLDLFVTEFYGSTGYYQNTSDISIIEQSSAFAFDVFPMPAKDIIHIDTREQISGVEIMDINGKLIFAAKEIANGIGIEKLPVGTYMLKLINTDGKFAYKEIIKQ